MWLLENSGPPALTPPHLSCVGTAVQSRRFLSTAAVHHVAGYTIVAALAVLAYGVVSQFLRLFFHNLVVPAMVVLIWESINVFLRPILKEVSVIFYLESLCRLQIPTGGDHNFATTTDPVPTYMDLPRFICLTAVMLVASAVRIGKMEISYGTDWR